MTATLPTTPAAWAIRLSKILQHFQDTTGESMYPIKVQEIACEVSKQFFPSEPITYVSAGSMSSDFDGMMIPVPQKKGQWGIVYNDAVRSRGRINFTLAHEFGHYLLHRAALANGIQCGRDEMMSWDAAQKKLEAEANEFASYLLMPRNLFEDQMKGETLNLHLMQHVADHFDVSITAALLKWISFTSKRAMIVVTRDGFVKWAKPSDAAFKSGLFLAYKKNTIELPAQSLAARRDPLFDNEAGTDHAVGIWPFKEGVREMTLLADSYDMTISLLLFDDRAPVRYFGEEAEEEDTFDRFNRSSSASA